VRDDLKIVPVLHMDQVLEVALHPPFEKPNHSKWSQVKKEEKESESEAEFPEK
jgi:hypothetical protein